MYSREEIERDLRQALAYTQQRLGLQVASIQSKLGHAVLDHHKYGPKCFDAQFVQWLKSSNPQASVYSMTRIIYSMQAR